MLKTLYLPYIPQQTRLRRLNSLENDSINLLNNNNVCVRHLFNPKKSQTAAYVDNKWVK